MPIRAPITCQLSPEALRDKALLALEDAVQECRYRTPRRSFAVRFALAYLWAYRGGSRDRFDELWAALGRPKSPASFSVANVALLRVYLALGLERDNAIEHRMWERWAEQERNGG